MEMMRRCGADDEIGAENLFRLGEDVIGRAVPAAGQVHLQQLQGAHLRRLQDRHLGGVAGRGGCDAVAMVPVGRARDMLRPTAADRPDATGD